MSDAPPAADLLAEVTFALAGRVSDATVANIRASIADSEIEEATRMLSSALADPGVEVGPDEARFIDSRLASLAGVTRPRLRRAPAPTRPEFRFSPPPDGAAPELLRAAASVADWADGLAGLWLTLRTSRLATAAPLWLGEARDGSDVIEIAAEIQHRLATLGEVPPRVEVFTPATELTAYHRAALARAELVWVAPDLPEPRIAQTFDAADPVTGPYFRADHARLAGPDRDRVLAYLTGAEVLLAGWEAMVDVVEPAVGAVVPMTFRCDGHWIWTEPVAYYLRRYALSPDPALTAHALAAGSPAPLSPLGRAPALAAIAGPDPDAEPDPNPNPNQDADTDGGSGRTGEPAGRMP